MSWMSGAVTTQDGPAVQEERAVAEMKHRVQMEAQQLELEHIQYEREQLKGAPGLAATATTNSILK